MKSALTTILFFVMYSGFAQESLQPNPGSPASASSRKAKITVQQATPDMVVQSTDERLRKKIVKPDVKQATPDMYAETPANCRKPAANTKIDVK